MEREHRDIGLSIVRTASEGLAYLRSTSSPCGSSVDLVDRPTTEMFSRARTRVWQTSMTYLRDPGNVWVGARGARVDDGGDPLGDAVGIGRDARRRAAVVDVDVDIDQPRGHDRAADVEDVPGVGLGDVGRCGPTGTCVLKTRSRSFSLIPAQTARR